MGAILRVWDRDLRRTLAMKVVLGQGEEAKEGNTPAVDDKTLGRFLEEAQVTGQLDHPGIVPVHELGLDSDGPSVLHDAIGQGHRAWRRLREGSRTPGELDAHTRYGDVCSRCAKRWRFTR